MSSPKSTPATQDAAEAAPAPRRRRTSLTGRAAILAVVVAALAIALAAPVRQLVGQRAQINSLRTSVASQQSQVAQLKAAQKLWANPSYVAAQAEQRLHYVKPGQVPIITLAPTPAPGASPSATAAPALDTAPWYAELWTSVRGAGKPVTTPKPTSTVAPTPPS
jgi:cell division protein FtsB